MSELGFRQKKIINIRVMVTFILLSNLCFGQNNQRHAMVVAGGEAVDSKYS